MQLYFVGAAVDATPTAVTSASQLLALFFTLPVLAFRLLILRPCSGRMHRWVQDAGSVRTLPLTIARVRATCAGRSAFAAQLPPLQLASSEGAVLLRRSDWTCPCHCGMVSWEGVG